jgi:hypothetical protein
LFHFSAAFQAAEKCFWQFYAPQQAFSLIPGAFGVESE